MLKYIIGAVNKATNAYEFPYIANKKSKYKCFDCDQDVFLRKGKILRPHFAHYKSDNKCNIFNKPSESQIHKSAKYIMKRLIENNDLTIEKKCNNCDNKLVTKIPKYDKSYKCIIEYGFKLYGNQKYADVALITYDCDNELVIKYGFINKKYPFSKKIGKTYIFEVCYKHKTEEENRPEPWFEIDATNLVNIDLNMNDITLFCQRNYTCKQCIKNKYIKDNKLKWELEKYIRERLGQKYPEPEFEYTEFSFYSRRVKHLRLEMGIGGGSYDDKKYILKNKDIIEKFNDYFIIDNEQKNVFLDCWKGLVTAYVISEKNYKKYDYWCLDHAGCFGQYGKYPYEYCLGDIFGGTVEIIKEIINFFQHKKSQYEGSSISEWRFTDPDDPMCIEALRN